MLVQLGPWQELAGAFAGQVPAIRALGERQLRWLARSLTLPAGSLAEPSLIFHYVQQLIAPITGEVGSLAGDEAFTAAIAQRPDILHRVCCLIEILRGVSRGTAPRSQKDLFNLMHPILPALLRLQDVYHSDPQVTCLIIKLAGDLVEAHISFVKVAEAAALCDWVLAVLKKYSGTHMGMRSVAMAAAADDAYRDLRALLKLLTHLAQRDLLDFSGDSHGESVDVAAVVLVGLGILVPLMQGDLLHFPKLARAYFHLLAHMLEVYPERVASLPEDHRTVLLQTLEYGVTVGDVEVTQSTLEALAALARFHLAATAAGHSGFIVHSDGGSSLAPFLEVLLKRLLLEDASRDTVELAADALLPLILAHHQVFQHLGEKLLAGQGEAEARALLTKALTDLLATNGVTASVDRDNRKRFRANLGTFVAEARNIIRTC
eukprot:jgi/Botrbrau1/17081/Bobra.0647s0003.1